MTSATQRLWKAYRKAEQAAETCRSPYRSDRESRWAKANKAWLAYCKAAGIDPDAGEEEV